jgi:transcriptional regulator with XRE-family HTH domain
MTPADNGSSNDFARAFGDALADFLKAQKMSQSEAARRLGLGKARINTYCHDSPKGKRRCPDAEVLYRTCVEFGFEFEFRGHRISAQTLNAAGTRSSARKPQQLELEFDRQFNLTKERGTVSVSIKRPNGRVEISLTLVAAS